MEQEYQKLEQNLIDLIKEEQMKLGYQKETIRLYYPADSLLRLLGKELSIEKLQQELESVSYTHLSCYRGRDCGEYAFGAVSYRNGRGNLDVLSVCLGDTTVEIYDIL